VHNIKGDEMIKKSKKLLLILFIGIIFIGISSVSAETIEIDGVTYNTVSCSDDVAIEYEGNVRINDADSIQTENSISSVSAKTIEIDNVIYNIVIYNDDLGINYG
jgi:hypothetical protein